MTNPNDMDGQPGERAIVVERTLGAARADGRAVVRHNDAMHERLAGARAWASLGRARQAEQAFEDAVAAARNGIQELGRDYRPPESIDDTDLKRAAAEEQYTGGRIDHAAEGLLRVLDTRIRLYVLRYSDDVVE